MLCLILTALSISIPSYAFRVVIDPGHGGSDRGASRHGYFESKITLAVSKILNTQLRQAGFETLLTRTSDRFLGLQERAEKANQFNGDLFISIHANASIETRARGVEFYFQNQLPANEEALYLAARENESSVGEKHRPIHTTHHENSTVSAILDDLKRNQRISQSDRLAQTLFKAWNGGTRKRKSSIRQAPFYLVSNVDMPSALVELGYVTNKNEAKLLSKSSTQKKLAENIFSGIVKFKEMLDKSSQ